MRGSGWIFALVSTALWLAVFAWPATSIYQQLITAKPTEVQVRPVGQLLLTSVVWSAGIAVGAVILGWAPGRVLGRSLVRSRGGFFALATLMLVPICLPSYLVFYAWWQSWPPDSAVYRWALEHDHVRTLKLVTLAAGLLCWSWPIVTWCVAGVVASTPAQREEMLRLDAAPIAVRLVDALRCDVRGLTLGALLVFLIVFNNTTCFDLAEVFTFANEVRAVEALGANATQVTIEAVPASAIALLGAIAAWILLGSRPQRPAMRGGSSSFMAGAITSTVWCVSVMVPLSLFVRHVLGSQHSAAAMSEFVRLYWGSMINTVVLAAVSAAIGAMLALGLATMWSDQRRLVRGVAHVQAITWLAMGLLPATLTALAMEAAFNRGALADVIYRTPAIVVVGHLACFGFVAALLARWCVRQQSREVRELAQLDSAGTLTGLLQAARPQMLAAAVAALAVVLVLAIGEIPVTAKLNPPMRAGWGPLAITMLNDMHYQRPQTVMAAAVVMVFFALACATVAVLATRVVRRRTAALLLLVLASIGLASCHASDDDSGEISPIDTVRMFGFPGLGKSQFSYPRAIDVDAANGWVYVIDKAARVQRLDAEGQQQLEWRMPDFENGKPTGVSVAPQPDGRVFVPDTHYHRIMIFSPDGKELARFGEYGEGPRQFIYPTDVAFGPEGRLYVSEYGGNDRIQVLDSQGNYLFEFGGFGEQPGQFNRPQSLAFNADRTELFIADACNHRIVVTDPSGKVLRMFGTPGGGRKRGQLAYPYGLAVLADGTIMVSEFGNNRVQRFDASGRSLGVWGRIGRGEGDVQYPWGVAQGEHEIFVLDSGNNRVQVMREP